MSDEIGAYTVKNANEEIVEVQVARCMKYAEMCACDRCRADVTAIALNNLPPRYCVTERGKNLLKVDAVSAQTETDLIAAVMSAVMQVSKQPRHG